MPQPLLSLLPPLPLLLRLPRPLLQLLCLLLRRLLLRPRLLLPALLCARRCC